MDKTPCQICKDQAKLSKYRCPQCQILFCSLQCNKSHKSDKDKPFFCETFKSKPSLTFQEPLVLHQEERRPQNSDLILDDSDVIVPDWRLRKAVESPKIKAYLSHSKLKAIIRDIDGTVYHKKKVALRRRMRNDPDFQVFIDDLLKELGYMNEQGMFEVVSEEQPVVPKQKLIETIQDPESLPSYHELDDDVSEHHEEDDRNTLGTVGICDYAAFLGLVLAPCRCP